MQMFCKAAKDKIVDRSFLTEDRTHKRAIKRVLNLLKLQQNFVQNRLQYIVLANEYVKGIIALISRV